MWRQRREILIGAASLTATSLSACAMPRRQTRGGSSNIEVGERISSSVRRFADSAGTPAVNFGLVHGNWTYVEALGPSAREHTSSTRSVFHLASLAKPVVAFAVLQLAQGGRLQLDAPVVSRLPYFHVDDDASGEITIRQLLTHTSGLPDVENYGWDDPQTDDGALERYVRSLQATRLIARPGDRVQYSNMGYDILGDVIAKASRMPFESFIEASIFRPLGMGQSTFLLSDVPAADRMSPYFVNADRHISPVGVFPYNRSHAPSSTLYSTAPDMLKWLRLNLGGGRVGGTRLLSRRHMNEMLRVAASRTVRSEESLAPFQGLGWSGLTIDGVLLFGHGGHDAGFRAVCLFAPEAQAGVVLMTNGDGDHVNIDGLGLSVMGTMLDRDWSRFEH